MAEKSDFTKKLNGYFIGFCRKSFSWSPLYKEARRQAFVEKKQGLNYFRCGQCKGMFSQKETHVDHKVPVVSTDGNTWDWNTYRDRLFCEQDGLWVLCVTCHKEKTKAENSVRMKNRPANSKHLSAMASWVGKHPKPDSWRKQAIERCLARSKAVRAFDPLTGQWTVYVSIQEAARDTGVAATNIVKVLKRKRFTAGGLEFEYCR